MWYRPRSSIVAVRPQQVSLRTRTGSDQGASAGTRVGVGSGVGLGVGAALGSSAALPDALGVDDGASDRTATGAAEPLDAGSTLPDGVLAAVQPPRIEMSATALTAVRALRATGIPPFGGPSDRGPYPDAPASTTVAHPR